MIGSKWFERNLKIILINSLGTATKLLIREQKACGILTKATGHAMQLPKHVHKRAGQSLQYKRRISQEQSPSAIQKEAADPAQYEAELTGKQQALTPLPTRTWTVSSVATSRLEREAGFDRKATKEEAGLNEICR